MKKWKGTLLSFIVLFSMFGYGSTAFALLRDDAVSEAYDIVGEADTTATKEEKEFEIDPSKITTPVLQVNIPGISFKNSVVIGTGKNGCNTDQICVKTVDIYLNAVYKWSTGAAIIIAIILLMVGGVEYMIGSAVGTIEKAKTRIKNAMTGLLILLSITAILSFVNPAITNLGAIKLKVIASADDISPETKEGIPDNLPAPKIPTKDPVTGDPLLVYETESDCLSLDSGVGVHPGILEALETAACALESRTGNKLRVSSGGRTPASQAESWLANFRTTDISKYVEGRKQVCNPWKRTDAESPFTAENHAHGPWTVDQAILDQFSTKEEIEAYLKKEATNNDSIRCPHVTGTTVDVWCKDDGGSHTDSIACHFTLEEEMGNAGFKRLNVEGWHFEYAQNGIAAMSGSAISGVWSPGLIKVNKICSLRPDVYNSPKISGETCVFDYSLCTSTHVNLDSFCCSDKAGVCCDGKSGGTPDSGECNP